MDELFDCFKEVVRNALGMKMSADKIEEILDKIPNESCEDQYVGRVSKILSENPDVDFPVRRKLEDLERGLERYSRGVVIVLESPSKAEFCKVGGKYKSRGPARSCTGCRFREYWPKISEGKFGDEWKDYAIFLINAVQYQCSLVYAGLRGEKGKVFCTCMEQERFRESLRLRIGAVNKLCANTILVNACTRDCKGEGYKAVSEILLQCKTDESRVFGTTHPSGWQCPRNRVLEELDDSDKLPSIRTCHCKRFNV